MSVKKSIAKAGVVVFFFSVIGKILGFAREIIIAAFFGATYKADAYFIGLAGPEFIREIVSGGVLTAVFIPIYSSTLAKKGDTEARKFLGSVLTILFAVLIALIFAGVPLSKYLVKAIAPELTGETLEMASIIARIVFPGIIFMGFTSIFGSLLNVHGHFAAPSMSQAMLNIGIISGVAVLSGTLGVKSLAVGFLAGAVLQFLVVYPVLRSKKLGFSFGVHRSEELKEMLGLWLPLFFMTVASTANDLVSRSLASGLDSGNISGVSYAGRIRETVLLLCGVPLGTAVFPHLSAFAAQGKTGELEDTTFFALRLVAFIALPFSVFMLVFATPVVRLLFERGMFDAGATQLTSSALTFYSAGAVFFALVYIIVRVYYSTKNTKKPLFVFLAAFAVNIIAGIILRKDMNAGGITLARSIADASAFFMLLFGLRKIFPGVRISSFLGYALKIAAIALVSSYLPYIVLSGFLESPGKNTLVWSLPAAVAAAAVMYVSLSLLFKVKEMKSIAEIAMKKMGLKNA